ncbi:MAG: TRAP transporter substrate-binding protein [Gammaproteobacteria bacterium]|nr:TRAP transporter substrate-binding protein [Gammaproteobacteria bacterium]
MQRRDLIRGLGLGAAAAATAACSRRDGEARVAGPGQRFEWKLVTTWPPNFPGLGTGAVEFARRIEACSGGRLSIRVFGDGEFIPAFEVFDAVASGTAEMAHGAAYYWKGKIAAAPFFCAVPFGLTAQEMNAWLYHGGGLELWQEAYAPFGLLPLPCGSSGCQMGGWFRRELRSLADLQGLKMRMPGLGGEVLARAGATPVTLPGSEIFTALQTGAIDATEWVGPYNDLAFGLHKAAKFYYYPGWHEPGSTLELIVNRQAFDSLPADLQEIVRTTAAAINDRMLAEFTARNAEALQTLVNEHGVELRPFPPDVLARLQELSVEVLQEAAGRDALFARVLESWQTFRRRMDPYLAVAERAMLNTRGG